MASIAEIRATLDAANQAHVELEAALAAAKAANERALNMYAHVLGESDAQLIRQAQGESITIDDQIQKLISRSLRAVELTNTFYGIMNS